MTCYVDSGDTVGAAATVTATLNGVTNPRAGSPTLAVSTSSDVTPATSPTYTVTAARSVSGVGVGHQSPDLGGRRADHLRGLVHHLVDRRAGRQRREHVTIALPANTGLGSFNDGGYYYSSRSTWGPPRSATANPPTPAPARRP